jgi:1,4-alpha-glucan branching enzyme
MTALSYLTPGMPLIYSGDEYGLDHSLKFFEKDSIPKTKGAQWEWRVKLGKLKNENPALNGGKKKATYTRIATSDDTKILAFERSNENNKVIYLANMTNALQLAKANIEGNYLDYMSGKKITFVKDQKLNLKPWQYYILVKE